jgi:8-oxo-dGTP pyrophosphatase MutT (NUDIX family)
LTEIQAAVSIILAPGARGREILFIHRAERPDDPWSGHMALPGGRREPKDKDLLATALRETREETGVILRKNELVTVLDDLRPRNRSIPPVVVRPHVFALEAQPPVRLSEEAVGYFWVPIDRLKSSACRVHVPERKVLVDAYLVGPRIVWGITLRILKAFLRCKPCGQSL